MRRGVHTPSRARHSLMSVRETCEHLRMRKNLAKRLLHRICKETVVTLSTTCDLAIGDLAIGDLGVRAIESLDVRVATISVRMMKRKKVGTSKFSNFDSSTLILLAMLHRTVFALFSRSSVERNYVVFVLVEDL